MSKKRIEDMLPAAIGIVGNDIQDEKLKIIDEKFKGYVSSFIVSVRQNGLLGAVLFFGYSEDTASKSAKDRYKLCKVIHKLMCEMEYISAANYPNMKDYAVSNQNYQSRELVSDCACAIKLAMKAFRIAAVKKEDGEKNDV